MRSAGVIAATVGRAVYLRGRLLARTGSCEVEPLLETMAAEQPVMRIAAASGRSIRLLIMRLVFIDTGDDGSSVPTTKELAATETRVTIHSLHPYVLP
jgi:hypothetical protein